MKKIFFYAFALCALSSCTHNYYMPASHNVPLFKEKNVFRASGSQGGGAKTGTTEVQAAYAVTNQLAVMSTVMRAKGGVKEDDNWGEGHYYDAAVGYYKPLGKNGVFELFGGFGRGHQHHEYSPFEYSNLSFNKVFIQPSIGITTNTFDVAFTPSFSRLFFYDIASQINTDDSDFEALMKISDSRMSILYEPSVTIRGGWKYLKVQLQMGNSGNLTHKDLSFEKSKMNAGLSFAFAQRFMKKKDLGLTHE
jgi:hypothetical protein